MRTFYIYKTTNIINGKSYIGQHEIPVTYKESFNRYLGSGVALKAAIKKYGKENFTKEILEYIEDDYKHEKVSEREKYWIKKENTISPNGYNVSPGGEGGVTSEIAKRSATTRKARGYKHSEETKHKMSEKSKNIKKSEEHKKHLSENHHLRTLHIILHEDGIIEETYLSMNNIAKQYNTNQNTLLRHSAKNEFINGILLMNIDPDKYECCNSRNNKEKSRLLCFDPIKKDICTLCALKNRKYRPKTKETYKDIKPNDCLIKGEINEI